MRFGMPRWKREQRERERRAYATEGALCDAFAALARADGFAVHAETSGWDLLLARRADGFQVGVQAKLRPNVDVIAQAVGGEHYPGPDVHAVLVPVPSDGFIAVAHHLRLLVFSASDIALGAGSVIARVDGASLWPHSERAWTPPVEIVGFGGGRSNPRQITPWKLAACRLCAVLRQRGFLTRPDFKLHRLSPTWWMQGSPPVLRCERVGKVWRYVPGGAPLPDERWPEVARALLSEPTGVRYRTRRR